VEHLAAWPQASMHAADAHDVEAWRGARKVSVAFAVSSIPLAWIDAGGVLVAPVVGPQHQTLTLVRKSKTGAVSTNALSPVRYVRDRSATALQRASSD
jgi:protein-L-isoaspartate O-methyltransferase